MRLVGEDVEARAGDAALLQRRDQGMLVDDRAAGDVDQEAVGPERVENLAGRPGGATPAPPAAATTSTSHACGEGERARGVRVVDVGRARGGCGS